MTNNFRELQTYLFIWAWGQFWFKKMGKNRQKT